MKYLEGLNDAQKRAVTLTVGPVSVLAGAGAGKTKVLATRIYHLIRQGVPENKILAITFTNKAAREMRERVKVLFGGDHTSVLTPFIATFHGLGRELLESYGTAVGVPRYFSIFDRDDSEKVIAEALKALDISTKELSPRAVLAKISRAKGEGMTVGEFQEKESKKSFSARTTSQIWLRYEEKLHKEKALDFDDLIALPVRLLEEHAEVRKAAQERWDYIHIDEYQDTNELQERLAGLLVEKHKNLFVVGDGDQLVYSWRGARMENILEFEKRYPAAQTIVLEHNYRSSKTIVDASNTIIEKNRNRKKKISKTDNAQGEKILAHVAVNAEDEAAWIAQEIKKILRLHASPENIAILFRTNFQSRALEEGLLHAGIPYRLLGTRFFERKEVKDCLAWIRLSLEPSRETDRMRAAQFPPRGIGKTTLGKLAEGKREELRAGDKAKVEAFEKIIEELSQASETSVPSEFVRLVVLKSGIKKILEEGSEEDKERFENVQELASLASRHDVEPGRQGIAAFLAEAALASDQDEMDRDETKKGVTLMTVHAAKGLEFETVFVTGLEEGLFPHQGMGDESDRDEEEERRLFYVAITRAKKRLVLTMARVRKIYGMDYLSEPSSFLRDLDEENITYAENPDSEIIEA